MRPCIFHMHGGGFVVGSAAMMDPSHRALALELDCSHRLEVDYRLAPETLYPGAIEDCYAALAWLFKEAPRLGVDSSRIGVMGESAGGGLAAALALLTRDRGEYRLAFQHLIYPMLDDRTCVSAEPASVHAANSSGRLTTTRSVGPPLLNAQPGSDGVSILCSPGAGEGPERLANGVHLDRRTRPISRRRH